jgi:hypothetical protein
VQHSWPDDETVPTSVPEPREGGVKIVFDVREGDAEEVTLALAGAGFAVTRYYDVDHEHRAGGSPIGWIRLGADRPAREFSKQEQDRIVALFDAAQSSAGFSCDRLGTDVWTAGDAGPATPVPQA